MDPGNTKIGPVLEVATSYLHGKYGVEIRIMSLNRDNAHSWVRISHGPNKFVMNLNNNETEISEVQLEENALKLDAKDFACQSKAKAKPQRREPVGSSPRTVPIGKRTWTDVEPGKYSFSDFEVSKEVMYLLRHSQQMHREEDGAVQFWRMKENFQKHFLHSPHWSDSKWKACLAGGGEGNKKRYQYCTDSSGTIVYIRALQGHSGSNLIDPSLQDNVVIQSNFFQYIYHVGCAFNLHSIISSGLRPWGQSSSKRQTVLFLPVDLMDKSHKDPDVIDLSFPRRAQYVQKTWKRHQDAENWVDINLAFEKELRFYQTRSNAIIFQEKLPAYCIPKVVRMETGEVLYEKVYMSPRPTPKISLKHERKRKLGSEHAQRSEVGQLSGSFQSNRPILSPSRERTVRPVVKDDTRTVQDGRTTSRSQEIDVNSFHEESVSSERTERPVVETSVIQARSSEDSKDRKVEKAHERTRRLVVGTKTENVPDSSQTRSCHESETFNVGDKTLRERTGRPVVDNDNLCHEQTMLNKGNMDFQIPGLSHSVVKHAQSSSVRELIQKIENHPDGHALQQNLRQNQANNPFSPESNKMIQEVGKVLGMNGETRY